MYTPAALEQIKKSCNTISAELIRLHPAVGAIANKEAKDEMLKTLFELTKQVEMVKKLARKVELKASGADAEVPPVL